MPPKKRASKGASVMLYSIAGDIIGGPFEFRPNNVFTEGEVTLFDRERYARQKLSGSYKAALKNEFTDDSVLSMAIARALRESRGMDEEERLKVVSDNLKKFHNMYPEIPGAYGGLFEKWASKKNGTTLMTDDKSLYGEVPPYASDGDGSAMRISSAGQGFGNMEDGLVFSKDASFTTHGSRDAINAAQAIGLAGQLARAGRSKDEIKLILETRFNYDLSKSLDEIREFNRSHLTETYSKKAKGIVPLRSNQIETAYDVAQMALTVILNSDNYLDCMTKVISIGGDSDTVGSMDGGIAGAAWGMPRWMQKMTRDRLDDFMLNEARDFDDFLEETPDIEPDQDEIEVALTKAKLDRFLLDKYKAGNRSLYGDDKEEFLDKLADLEAAQMVYEKIREAREKKDELTVQALQTSKESILAELKRQIKSDPEFISRADEFANELPIDVNPKDPTTGTAKPARTDRTGIRAEGTEMLYERNIVLVRHEEISGKLLDRGPFENIIGRQVDAVKPVLETQAKEEADIMKLVEAEVKKQDGAIEANSDGKDVFKDEKYYNNVIEGIRDEIAQFCGGEIPKELKDIFADFERLKKAQEVPEVKAGINALEAQKTLPMDDPDRICEQIQKKLDGQINEKVGNIAGREYDNGSIQTIAYMKRLSNSFEKLYNAPVSEKDAYEFDRSRLDNFRKKLNAAKTGFDSSEYKTIISMVKKLKELDAKPPKPDSAHRANDTPDRTPKQDHVAKLYSIQLAINGYLEHKGRDGINKNTYHKLAAVEELNQYISRRITELEPKPFVYYGNEIPKSINGPADPGYAKDVMAENFRDASKRNLETNSREYANALRCMSRIEEKAEKFTKKPLTVKQKESIKDMKNKFFKDPGSKETIKVESLFSDKVKSADAAAKQV